MVRTFQAAHKALRIRGRAVVVCPAGLTIGGGCEIALHAIACRRQAEALHRVGRGRGRTIPEPAAVPRRCLARGFEGVPDPMSIGSPVVPAS